MTRHSSNNRNIIMPEVLVQAYKQGYFPMAESKEGEIYWHCPDPRAIIPLSNPNKPRSLKQSEKKYGFKYSVDTDFESVIRKCSDREDTWISEEIIISYLQLHELGFAHSVETYSNDKLVGGLYGVAIGGAFFGESMFNNITDAAKGAFYYLVKRLKQKKFLLLDTQYINPFTEQLGAIEIPYSDYLKILIKATNLNTNFVK